MPVDISIQGGDELAKIGAELKRVGNGDLRRELLRGLNRSTKPLKAAVKRSALDSLPRRGGLNQRIAGAKIGSSNRASGRNGGVRLTGKLSGHDLDTIEKGVVRHPVFGRNPWVSQPVTAGFFSKPIDDNVDEVRKELLDVLEDVARRLV